MSRFLGLIFLLLASNALSSPAEEREETRIPILETVDDFFGQRVNSLANDFDSFFATDRADDELGRSRVRIRTDYRVEERNVPRDDIQFRFNLKLPKLEQRFKFSDDDDKDKKKKDGRLETEEERKKKAEAFKKKNEVIKDWLFNVTGNVNASTRPSVRIIGRARKNMETGTLIHRFSQELNWVSTADGLRQRTQLGTDHSFDQNLLFRFNNLADWRISRKDFTTSHGPSLFHRLTDFDAMNYGVSVSSAVVDGVWFLTGYNVYPTYRRNVYKDILYAEITPGLSFPKTWSFRRTPYIFVRIEMLFGSSD